jgi:signal peptide peptidase SppA
MNNIIHHVGAWLMEPRRLSLMLEHANGRKCEGIDMASVIGERQKRLAESFGQGRGRQGYTAVIPIHGPIEPRLSFWSFLFGGCAMEEVHQCLDHYLGDSACESILLDIDSPGGTVHGTQELADRIFNARSIKPINAIANPFCASAAYWIGSAASKLMATPSADVGSVGVVMTHSNIGKMLEEDGVEITMISSGKYKTEGNPYEPLSKEARAYYQAESDTIHERFISAVARNRNVSVMDVRSNFGQGRMLMSDAALAVKMIDEVNTFQSLVGSRVRSLGGVDREATKRRQQRLKLAVERERTGKAVA